MFCPNCGSEVSPTDVACAKCGHPLKAAPTPAFQAPETPISNHLVGAILVTLFCCLPFGIVSIVYAASVNGKVACGDLVGARAASSKAMTWILVSLGVGLVAHAISLIYYFLAFLSAVVTA